jgi:hypothetical protein
VVQFLSRLVAGGKVDTEFVLCKCYQAVLSDGTESLPTDLGNHLGRMYHTVFHLDNSDHT